MRLYNTLSGKKELLKKPAHTLRLFVCGITPYDHAHLGHARLFLVFDSFVKYLRSQKWNVTYIQNVTDIDDKIITRAHEHNTTWKHIARTFEQAYHRDEKSLGITAVSKYARATNHISAIVRQIKTLIQKGYAYKIEKDGYYFDIQKFKDYGKLSHRTVQQAEDATSRIDESSHKRNKGDFALWKFSKKGEPSWNTPLGTGRPGWHIEDTAITETYFGPQYDLHGGASELKFPHHEAEIAQQEAASGKKPFVKLWMHVGVLLVAGKKMSKSLQNFITIHDFIKQYNPLVFRYLVLTHHYRSPIDYTDTLVEQAIQALITIQKFIWKLSYIQKPKQSKSIALITNTYVRNFYAALEDDFNTPLALAAVFSYISACEKQLHTISPHDAKKIQHTLCKTLQSIGISLSEKQKIPASILRRLKKREDARVYKQFIQADTLRNQILQVGYEIEDTPWGPYAIPSNLFRKNI